MKTISHLISFHKTNSVGNIAQNAKKARIKKFQQGLSADLMLYAGRGSAAAMPHPLIMAVGTHYHCKDFAMPQSSEVAYCGLFCKDCIIRNGRIGALSSQLLKSIETSDFHKLSIGLPKIMPEFEILKDYQTIRRLMAAMTKLDCVNLCKEGGGSTACPIKKCCREKKLEGCWDCDDFVDCKTLAWLNPVHAAANIKNIERIRRKGMALFLKGPKFW